MEPTLENINALRLKVAQTEHELQTAKANVLTLQAQLQSEKGELKLLNTQFKLASNNHANHANHNPNQDGVVKRGPGRPPKTYEEMAPTTRRIYDAAQRRMQREQQAAEAARQAAMTPYEQMAAFYEGADDRNYRQLTSMLDRGQYKLALETFDKDMHHCMFYYRLDKTIRSAYNSRVHAPNNEVEQWLDYEAYLLETHEQFRELFKPEDWPYRTGFINLDQMNELREQVKNEKPVLNPPLTYNLFPEQMRRNAGYYLNNSNQASQTQTQTNQASQPIPLTIKTGTYDKVDTSDLTPEQLAIYKDLLTPDD